MKKIKLRFNSVAKALTVCVITATCLWGFQNCGELPLNFAIAVCDKDGPESEHVCVSFTIDDFWQWWRNQAEAPRQFTWPKVRQVSVNLDADDVKILTVGSELATSYTWCQSDSASTCGDTDVIEDATSHRVQVSLAVDEGFNIVPLLDTGEEEDQSQSSQQASLSDEDEGARNEASREDEGEHEGEEAGAQSQASTSGRVFQSSSGQLYLHANTNAGQGAVFILRRSTPGNTDGDGNGNGNGDGDNGDVGDGVTRISFGSQTIDTLTYRRGQSITPVALPTATGGRGDITYSVRDPDNLFSRTGLRYTDNRLKGSVLDQAVLGITTYTFQAVDVDGRSAFLTGRIRIQAASGQTNNNRPNEDTDRDDDTDTGSGRVTVATGGGGSGGGGGGGGSSSRLDLMPSFSAVASGHRWRRNEIHTWNSLPRDHIYGINGDVSYGLHGGGDNYDQWLAGLHFDVNHHWVAGCTTAPASLPASTSPYKTIPHKLMLEARDRDGDVARRSISLYVTTNSDSNAACPAAASRNLRWHNPVWSARFHIGLDRSYLMPSLAGTQEEDSVFYSITPPLPEGFRFSGGDRSRSLTGRPVRPHDQVYTYTGTVYNHRQKVAKSLSHRFRIQAVPVPEQSIPSHLSSLLIEESIYIKGRVDDYLAKVIKRQRGLNEALAYCCTRALPAALASSVTELDSSGLKWQAHSIKGTPTRCVKPSERTAQKIKQPYTTCKVSRNANQLRVANGQCTGTAEDNLKIYISIANADGSACTNN